MEILGLWSLDTSKKQPWNVALENAWNDTKDKLQEILDEVKSQNISKVWEWKYLVWINWLKYYVCYINRKYNFDSGLETENKMLMDAWGIIDKVSSAWVVFVSKNQSETSLQYVFYDKNKDQISYKENIENWELAFNIVERYKKSS